MSRAQQDFDDIMMDRERGVPIRGGDPFGNNGLDNIVANWDSTQTFNNVANRGGSGGSGIGLPPLPGAATTSEVAAGVPGATPGLSGLSLPSAGGGGAGVGNRITNWLTGPRGLDPTTIGLGLLSTFFGEDPEDPFQRRESFRGQGLADPVNSLNAALSAIQQMAANISNRPPLRSTAVLPEGPGPISVPGIPFQIGGSFNMPMPSMEGSEPMPNPFGSPAEPRGPSPNGARRRNPGGGL